METIAWNIKSCFLTKIRTDHQFVVSWISPVCGKFNHGTVADTFSYDDFPIGIHSNDWTSNFKYRILFLEERWKIIHILVCGRMVVTQLSHNVVTMSLRRRRRRRSDIAVTLCVYWVTDLLYLKQVGEGGHVSVWTLFHFSHHLHYFSFCTPLLNFLFVSSLSL